MGDGTKKKSKKERKKEKLKSLEEENVSEESSEKENTEKISKKKQKKIDKEKEKESLEDENKNNKKRKRDETMEVDEEESSPKKSKFDCDDVITGLLMKKDGNEMKLNKLKKKCVSEFFSQNEGTHKTAEEVGSKFDKKLKKRRYRLLKDKVKLILDEEADESKNEVPDSKPAPTPVVEET